LEAGKFADFAVLAADPLSTPVEHIGSIDVVETWVGGRQIARSD
jgi:predicted amidohydrolase YtcJ